MISAESSPIDLSAEVASPAVDEPSIDRAQALLRNQATESAIECFEAVVRASPNDEAARTAYGVALASLGRAAEALKQFERAAEISSDAPQHRNVGVALMESGRVRDAVDAFRRAIVADPSYADGHRLLAEALKVSGLQAESLDAMQNWLRLQARNPDAILGFARSLRGAGRSAEAAIYLEHAVRNSDGDPSTLRRELGLLRLEADQVSDAECELDAALAANPRDVDAHAYLAVVRMRQGRRAEAVAQYEQALLLHRCRPNRWPDGVPKDVARIGLLYEADRAGSTMRLADLELPATAEGKLLTVLVGCYGSFPEYSVRCLKSITESPSFASECDVLIGLNACCAETVRAAEAAVESRLAAGLVRSTRNLNKDPMMRLLLELVRTPYVLWLDDDSHFIDPAWPDAVARFVRAEHPFDVAGQLARWGPRRAQDPSYTEFIRSRPWWRTDAYLPADLREWAPFVVGGLFLARTNYLRLHDFPDRGMTKAMDDVALGELVMQKGGRLIGLPPEVQAMVRISDGHRRGENFDLPGSPQAAVSSVDRPGTNPSPIAPTPIVQTSRLPCPT